jgi:hypothetical protein
MYKMGRERVASTEENPKIGHGGEAKGHLATSHSRYSASLPQPHPYGRVMEELEWKCRNYNTRITFNFQIDEDSS